MKKKKNITAKTTSSVQRRYSAEQVINSLMEDSSSDFDPDDTDTESNTSE